MGSIRNEDGTFKRAWAEEAVEKIMFGLDVSGDIVPSEEAGVVAFQTEDWVDCGEVCNLLQAAGLEVVDARSTKWQVEQWDDDVEDDVVYDERVIAVAFDCPGLDPEWRECFVAAAPMTAA